jgi:hypothetical protein
MSSSENHHDRLVEEYIARIHQALRDLPPERRDPIVEDIREHIRTSRAAMAPEDEAQIRQLLDDMGDPAAIRAEAGLPSTPQNGWADRLAPWLILFGGFVLIVGWLAGVVLLWNSSVWKTRDKVLATLIWPGGLAAAVYAAGIGMALPVSVQPSACSGGPGIVTHCTSQPGPGAFHVIAAILVLVILIAAPIVVNVRLIRIYHRSVA